MDFSVYLDACIIAVKKASEKIMQVYQNDDFEIEIKADNSPVTQADKSAGKIITTILKDNFPEIPILCEESEDNLERLKSDLCFIVDPLDGTVEFIRRTDMFTVNIGLVYKGEPVVGVIAVPVTGELYYACKGKGAFYNRESIEVSRKTKNICVLTSNSFGSQELDKIVAKYGIKNYRKVGSSLKGCIIAKGEAEVYYRFGDRTHEWDTCAMQCIVEQAGGIFRQLDDTKKIYNQPDTRNNKGFYIVNREENKFNLNNI